MSLLDRIVIDPEICHGKLSIRGLRYTMRTTWLPPFRNKRTMRLVSMMTSRPLAEATYVEVYANANRYLPREPRCLAPSRGSF